MKYFLGGGGKVSRCIGLIDFHVSTVLKSGSLKLLEPGGPVQACNGIALSLISKIKKKL